MVGVLSSLKLANDVLFVTWRAWIWDNRITTGAQTINHNFLDGRQLISLPRAFFHMSLLRARGEQEKKRRAEQVRGKERIPRRSFLVPQVNLFLGAPDLIVPFLLHPLVPLRARQEKETANPRWEDVKTWPFLTFSHRVSSYLHRRYHFFGSVLFGRWRKSYLKERFVASEDENEGPFKTKLAVQSKVMCF